MSKRKILLLAAMLCMIAILAVGGTLAYFTDETDTKKNTFTVGNVQIELVEDNWVASGESEGKEVYPGEALAKDPVVKNTGANPCFVRVSVTGLDCLGDAGLIQYRTAGKLGKLGADWEKHSDGYYYYTTPLAAGSATPALFDHIVIPTGLKNGDGKTPFSVNVQAQAVQAQGAESSWALVQEMEVDAIAKWFGTCGMPEMGK